jgi:bifunctional NMN adenylyltransferase/nudix hydrolase
VKNSLGRNANMPSSGVLIGRFQPFHEGHRFLVEQALAQFEFLVIVIGSSERARSTVNPFTYEERVALLKANLSDYLPRIKFVAVPDVFYDEAYWCRLVHKEVSKVVSNKTQITLLGHNKDLSSYYLQEFPKWDYVELPNYQGISATPLRQEYLLNGAIDAKVFSLATQKILQEFKNTKYFHWLQREAEFLKNYKASWMSAPFPPIFVTTDSICICKKHILLIERKHRPGQGLYALPGGFVEPNEWIRAGLIRELVEETQIEMTQTALENALITLRVFDYPGRSQIGRVITHAGLFKLKTKILPQVMGSDDAGKAFWLPLSELGSFATKLHDDHFQIIQEFMRQGLLK